MCMFLACVARSCFHAPCRMRLVSVLFRCYVCLINLLNLLTLLFMYPNFSSHYHTRLQIVSVSDWKLREIFLWFTLYQDISLWFYMYRVERNYANIVFSPAWRENTAIAWNFKLHMYPPLFAIQWRISPGMSDAMCKTHPTRSKSMPSGTAGELFDVGSCLQFVGALLPNRQEIFSRIGLCAVPRSNISHTEEERVVATSGLRLFGRAQESFI